MSDQRLPQSLRPSLLFGLVTMTAVGCTTVVSLPVAAQLTPVDVELSLLVDVSPSVSIQEYALQINGYRNAFVNLATEFGTGRFGNVAINFIQWTGPSQQQESIPWTLLDAIK